ncbi:hypothetical protein B6N60_01709 [Richelia sinica FACHB-800]|uniref:Uncharacterized protein n=1 Tax=Richelia sinica FACHB-800 TaxID=1357546 RepID=A0A975T7W0_9NOST|nr:hypothetical protein [Richelia sinica]MBD2666909.1 hypothetical protein [Richelia sinica FACHB-800]QXE23021.1 hypothetical protein B6N60_01709 [Richelia sinica FACHB-800]
MVEKSCVINKSDRLPLIKFINLYQSLLFASNVYRNVTNSDRGGVKSWRLVNGD